MDAIGLPGRTTRLLVTASLTPLLAACAVAPLGADPLSRAVSALVEPLASAREFSGAVALMRGDQLVYAQGFGQASHDPAVAFGPQTPSDGASLAKTFTAAGLWWLVHEGRLTIGSAVQAIVPEYPHAAVTVAQLMAHSNGLAPDYEIFDKHFAPGQPRTTEALLSIAGQTAYFSPSWTVFEADCVFQRS
jgi:CubicO group peptidase (beta-lactamase class C family)